MIQATTTLTCTGRYTRRGYQALRWSRGTFVIAVIAWLLYFSWLNRAGVTLLVGRGDLNALLVSVAALILSHLLFPLHVTLLLGGICPQISYKEAFLSYGRRLPARYLPGGVWHNVARAFDLTTLGVPKGHTIVAMLSQIVFVNGLSLALGGAGLAFIDTEPQWRLMGVTCAVLGSLAIFVVMGYIQRRTPHVERRKYCWRLFLSGAITLAAVVLVSAAFVFYILAFPGMVKRSIVEIGTIVLFARGIGFLAFFAPNGLGVSETVSASLLAEPDMFSSVTILLAGFRLVGITADIVTWFFVMFLILTTYRQKAIKTN